MTELAIREENTVAQVPAQRQPESSALTTLEQWARDAELAANIASKLAVTSFVPASFRGKVPETAAAILAGQELGLPPVAALRSMDVIQGTPALRAHAMRGLVQSHGHEVELVGEPTDALVVMRGRRKGAETWQQVKWDIPRAAKLALTGKDQWKKQPMTMLIARATGEICRLIASDVLYAMPYAAEELDGSMAPDGAALGAPRVTVEEILERPEALKERPAAIEAPSAVAPPSDTCGYCMEPGHLEDDCPQRAGDEYEHGTDGAGY